MVDRVVRRGVALGGSESYLRRMTSAAWITMVCRAPGSRPRPSAALARRRPGARIAEPMDHQRGTAISVCCLGRSTESDVSPHFTRGLTAPSKVRACPFPFARYGVGYAAGGALMGVMNGRQGGEGYWKGV